MDVRASYTGLTLAFSILPVPRSGPADNLVVAAVASSLLWFDTLYKSRNGKSPIQNRARILAAEMIRAPRRIVAITADGRWHSWRDGKESIELDIGRESSVLLRSAI